MEYAQEINERMSNDVEYKQKMVDAWVEAANNHYMVLTVELENIS